MGNKNSKTDLTEIELQNLEPLAPSEKSMEKTAESIERSKTVESAEKSLESAKFQDRVANYFDIVFVIGFAALAIILPFESKKFGLKEFVLEIFYCFWTLFMLAAALKTKFVIKQCGFLESMCLKSLFYIFLSSFAFNDLLLWQNDLVGGVFIAMSVINIMRCRRGKKNDLASLEKEAKYEYAHANDDHFRAVK